MSSSEHDPLADLPDLPWREPPAPRAECSAAIRAECTRDLCKKRGPSPRARVVASLLVIAVVAGALVFIGGRTHMRPPGALRAALLGLAGWGIVEVLVLFLALGAPPGKRLSRGLRLGIAVAVPFAFLVYLGWAAAYSLPLGQFLTSPQEAGWAAGCGFGALIFGALAAGGLMFIWRRTDPLTPGLSGAMAGLVGGLTSAAAMGCTCPAEEGWHLWLAHGLSVVAFVCLGAVLGRRWLSP